MKCICRDCEVDNDFQVFPCCELNYCDACALVETCSECHATACDDLTRFYTCEVCGKVEYEWWDSTFYCGFCHRIICDECIPFIKCKGYESCHMSTCVDCVNKDVGYVNQCKHCGEGFCSYCKLMEHCFRIVVVMFVRNATVNSRHR